MNRRKTRFIIIILSLFFFSVSSAVNYSNIYKMVRSNFRENPYDIANLTEDYMNTDTDIYEKLDFSGAIASVVCGVLFSNFIFRYRLNFRKSLLNWSIIIMK